MATEPTTTPGVNGAPISALDVLTLSQAAAYLQLPEETVRREAEAGRLVGRDVSGEWRFVRSSLAAWIGLPRPGLLHPGVDETSEEQEAFLESIRTYRDEVDRVTSSGKYAPE